jgi:hypothetical protein
MINLIILILYCRIFTRFLEDAIPKERKHVVRLEQRKGDFRSGGNHNTRTLTSINICTHLRKKK